MRPSQDTGYPDPHPRAYSNLFYKDGTDVAAVTPENWGSMIEKPGLEPLDVTEFNTSWSGQPVTSSPPPAHWMPHARCGLGIVEFDRAATGGRTLRGMGGSCWGHAHH